MTNKKRVNLEESYVVNEPDKVYRQKYNEYLHIHSCGTSTYTDEQFYRKHGSVDYMLNIITAGSLSYNTNNTDFDDKIIAKTGTVIIYKPHEPQYLSDMSPDLMRHWIHFTGVGVPELLQECGLNNSRFFTVNHTARLETIFLKIFNEMHSDQICKQIKLNSYMMDMLSEISRSIAISASAKSDRNDIRLAPAIDIINTQYKSKISLEQLARSCYMSKYYFVKLFKFYTGRTPHEYLTSVRIDIAKEMLRSTNMKIYTIAELVGIPDQNHFTKIFKSLTGTTPIVYRQKHFPQK